MTLAIGFLWPGLVAAQDLENRGDPIAWQYGIHLTAGEIRGVVFSDRGVPLENVQVVIEGLGIWAVTGADGEFRLTGVPAGERRIRFRMIGYGDVTQSLLVPSDVGMVVSAILWMQLIGGRCGDLRMRGDGLYMEVLDARTGEPLQVPVTVRLMRGVESWEQSTDLSQARHGGTPLAALRHRIEEAGEYDIEVEAEGYATWRREGVYLDIEWAVCDVTASNRRHTARLIPLD